MVVLVTGSNGQLGQSLQHLAAKYPTLKFVFCNSETLDITNFENVTQLFNQHKPQFCINTAAYTAVDKAESESEKAFEINVTGAKNLAKACLQNNTVLVHVSTDFVFDGESSKPYTENDAPNPTGIYGQTKLDGEKAIQQILASHLIIRTSWVYSQFGNNFMKTMLKLASSRDSLSVVSDQIGTPTNAVDLADAILKIISQNWDFETKSNTQHLQSNFGTYHFSNLGQCSWYDFAKKIFEIHKTKIQLTPIPTTSYPTPAKRPSYSVLDKSKILNVFKIEIKPWEESLKSVELNGLTS
jgi:dTDP-4-dehydrorhamnose reductase